VCTNTGNFEKKVEWHLKSALQAQLEKNLRQASMVTKTSAMSRDRYICENNWLCHTGSHARMVVPPSLSAL
jgi:hypothetical protein